MALPVNKWGKKKKKTVRNPGRDNAIYLRKMNKLNTMGREHPSQFKMLEIAVLPLPGDTPHPR